MRLADRQALIMIWEAFVQLGRVNIRLLQDCEVLALYGFRCAGLACTFPQASWKSLTKGCGAELVLAQPLRVKVFIRDKPSLANGRDDECLGDLSAVASVHHDSRFPHVGFEHRVFRISTGAHRPPEMMTSSGGGMIEIRSVSILARSCRFPPIAPPQHELPDHARLRRTAVGLLTCSSSPVQLSQRAGLTT